MESIPIAAEDIYSGSMIHCKATTGFGELLKKTASCRFLGVAAETVKNASGTAGGKRIKYYKKGVFTFLGTGLADTDRGKEVWAATESADAQITIVTSDPGATATKVGVIVDVEDSTHARVDITGYAGVQASDAS